MSHVASTLLCAELPHRDPAWIFDMLRDRAESVGKTRDLLRADGEELLLKRADPLINLALARFGFSAGIVVKFFQTEGDLRTAALTNRAWYVGRPPMSSLPSLLFQDSEEGFAEWLATAPQIDVIALFENPTLDDEVAARILLGREPFNDLPELQRIWAVWGLSENPALVVRDHPRWLAGIGADSRESLWKLAAIVPPSNAWALALSTAYKRIDPDRNALRDPKHVAGRWEPADRTGASPHLEVQEQLARLVSANGRS